MIFGPIHVDKTQCDGRNDLEVSQFVNVKSRFTVPHPCVGQELPTGHIHTHIYIYGAVSTKSISNASLLSTLDCFTDRPGV